MAAAVIEAQNVGKSYQKDGQRVTVLEGVSLSIADGEFVSIVGASGCGKTTLLRLVDGLIAPSSGAISLDGTPVVGPGPDRGFVFQQDSLLPWRTVLENIVIGQEFQGKRKEAMGEARRNAELVGLGAFLHHYPHELSGGMRQRVNIARALTLRPRVLLMDEPFAALDAQTREFMQEELLRIWTQTGKTVLFVTHQIDEAVYLSDRVVVLTVRPGRIKEEVAIDLRRPRSLRIKQSPEFGGYVRQIWTAIEGDIRRSLEIGAQE